MGNGRPSGLEKGYKMALDFEKNYTPLREAAEKMGIAYSTAHQYCKEGLLEGAILFRGTRWLVANETIRLWKNGEVNIKGAFRKRSGEVDD